MQSIPRRSSFPAFPSVFRADLDAEVGDGQPASLTSILTVGVALDDAGDGQQSGRFHQYLIVILAFNVKRLFGQPYSLAPVHQDAERLFAELDGDHFGRLKFAFEPLLFVQCAAVAFDLAVVPLNA